MNEQILLDFDFSHLVCTQNIFKFAILLCDLSDCMDFHLLKLKMHLNLLRTAGRFINQRHEGQESIISITIGNKKVALMQMSVESTH